MTLYGYNMCPHASFEGLLDAALWNAQLKFIILWSSLCLKSRQMKTLHQPKIIAFEKKDFKIQEMHY